MNWASVPVTTIDENGDTGTRENQVGSAAQAEHRLAVDEVSKASTMQLRTQCDLRASVALPLTTHAASHFLRRSRGGIARGAHSALMQCSISWGISSGLSIPTNPDSVVVQPGAVTTSEGPTTAEVTAGHNSFASVA